MPLYQNWKDVPKDKWPWANFSPRELACKGTGQLLVDETAINKLQQLRDALGKPLIVVSAYRSPEHNRRVGGATNSYHMKGVAFDISMANQDPMEFEIMAKEVGFRGIGYYPKQGFMHIDLGPDRHWGTPFKRSATRLVQEPEKRESIAESKTVQAVVAAGIASAGQGGISISALDGQAQSYLILIAGGRAAVSIFALAIIYRERIKAWIEGWR